MIIDTQNLKDLFGDLNGGIIVNVIITIVVLLSFAFLYRFFILGDTRPEGPAFDSFFETDFFVSIMAKFSKSFKKEWEERKKFYDL